MPHYKPTGSTPEEIFRNAPKVEDIIYGESVPSTMMSKSADPDDTGHEST